MQESSAEIIGLAEVNVNWWHSGSQTFFERTSRWLGGGKNTKHVSFAHNENDSQAPSYQIGGVVLIIRGQTVNRVMDWGKDELVLERWLWVDLRGIRGTVTRVIVAYRLVCTNNKEGKKRCVPNIFHDSCRRRICGSGG